MIYLDNASTTLKKPASVSKAVSHAIDNFANSGRSFYEASLLSNRSILSARMELSELFQTSSSNKIAFTSSATESFNLVLPSLINENKHVLTTILEHNSVLRPLYNTDCHLEFLIPDDNGNILPEDLEKKLKEKNEISIFCCTHGSNVIGNILPIAEFYQICKKYNVIFIVDISQTAGTYDVTANMADILCFTGHKSLFGPQGTGGIIYEKENLDLKIIKTGGSGSNSFDKTQSFSMPDIFEAGTLNAHSISGLYEGVKFINKIGIDKIREKELSLIKKFYDRIRKINNIKLFSNYSNESLPIISLLINGISSEELSLILWEEFEIATRAGIHCAPLLHKYFKTEKTGMTRFSLSYFTTEDEVDFMINALEIIAKCY